MLYNDITNLIIICQAAPAYPALAVRGPTFQKMDVSYFFNQSFRRFQKVSFLKI